ncbi:DUF4236 domain-containing protein [Alkaliphilus hydrothermalis]|uniref:Tetratricopeptide (TPR) repeat protein n=1 Tax=Alkaliphilus hydrothermalis TaxID=1482730 RepID=A0ABS2NSG7_9FIRM|nr:DUF4236 domain-containing protein [Alkaliphilus hydrothermalis]MBM7615892.1 tetratricopeptide (TPR) repeat protein [Alkaliphilus hydrothermalis]
MGLKFRKSVSLGKGLRLNLGKEGVSISGGVKGLRVGVGPRGVRTSATIPGTGVTITKSLSLQKLKALTEQKNYAKSPVTVVEGSQIPKILSNETPIELRSKYYMFQSCLGCLAILCILTSYFEPLLLVAGGLLIVGKLLWRRQTDLTAIEYKNIGQHFRSKKYEQCIKSIDIVLQHPKADPKLLLLKAECYLNLDLTDLAYEVYQSFFNHHLHLLDDAPEYWSPKVNTILMAIEKGDSPFALNVAETLVNQNLDEIDNRLWKGYLKGLCFMGLEEFEAAIHSFKDAIGRKRSMEAPYIDTHYQMGIAYSQLGKNSLAKKRFIRVYSSNSNYKEIAEIMEAINAGDDPVDVLED